MNDTTLIQLKIIIERAVRPVRASMPRKRKMREELLAHVSAVFEEEEARLGDGTAALARTQERFGPATELTGQLQASVPRSDSLGRFVEHLADIRNGESTGHRAVRHALTLSVIFGSLFFPVFVAQHRLHEWPIVPAISVVVFCFTFLTDAMRGALYGPVGRSWLRVMLAGVAASILVPGVTFGLCLIYSGEAWSSMANVLAMLPTAFLGALVVAAIAVTTEKELRYRREWDSLPIS